MTTKRRSNTEVADRLNEFHFEGANKPGAKPYREQGTAAFNLSPIQRQRRAIRDSAKLKSACMQFWTAAGLREDQHMPFEQYAHIHRRISMALAPELAEDEAQEAAHEDWTEDLDGCNPAEGIPFEKYSRGLFGVADMWTETVDELAYVIFINKLFRRVTVLREPPAPGASAAGASSELSQSLPRMGKSRPWASVRVGSTSEGSAGAFGGLAGVAGSLLAAARALTSPGKREAGAQDGAVAAGEGVAVDGAQDGAQHVSAATSPASEGEGKAFAAAASKLRSKSAEQRSSRFELEASQRTTNLWKGVRASMPTFRTFRELDEIVPLAEQAKEKPAPNLTKGAAAGAKPRAKKGERRTSQPGKGTAGAAGEGGEEGGDEGEYEDEAAGSDAGRPGNVSLPPTSPTAASIGCGPTTQSDTSRLSSPLSPLQVPSDDEAEPPEGLANAPKSSFSLKRRGADGVDKQVVQRKLRWQRRWQRCCRWL
ncbi:hypothetical protein Ctob_004626 [Chrysochromulina tobinii]|uniref:Uncharacterized protein n=1 Tax=Chrysochromulina tobinii TaxID=1460289 RepID=A0A0M0JY00_9EUKA|nr:hypothetical protein Ctob_004626 [Chrysochromulina tobinii]|eukprot:KOO31008.1 hypothetical protein Ctob_004626 [Chrysochromulina sp. CCMP291]